MKAQQATSRKRFARNDILLIAAVLLVAAIGMVYLFCFRQIGNTVTVTVDGKVYGVYALSQNIEKTIVTDNESTRHNRLIIRDGKAFVESASCPDGICVAHAPIFRDGESIVCLPNRVVITVTVNNTPDDPDIII